MDSNGTPDAAPRRGLRPARVVAFGFGVIAVAAIAVLAARVILGAWSNGVAAPAAATRETPVTVIATALPVPAPTVASLSPTSVPDKAGYKLAFHDEFTGDALDTKRWATSLPWGNTNRAELQYYTPRNVAVGGGLLTLTARKEPTNGKPYSSGVVSSFQKFTFQYGYAEIRAQIPAGTGLWPAFWLPATVRGTNDEVDIMEMIGSDPSLLHEVLHYGTSSNKRTSDGTYRGPDFSTGFHTYAVDWEPGVLVWYVDGVERRRLEQNVPTQPMYVITSLTVGGATSWSGAPDVYTVFPADLKVDYIRVYQRQ